MSVLGQAAGRRSGGHLALFLEPRAQNALGERARQLLGPAVLLGRKLALSLSTHLYRGLRLGPGLSQDLGSLLRMGGRKALHFLSTHTGFLPKGLVDKGSRALGSGPQRQDTDHGVGEPPLAHGLRESRPGRAQASLRARLLLLWG